MIILDILTLGIEPLDPVLSYAAFTTPKCTNVMMFRDWLGFKKLWGRKRPGLADCVSLHGPGYPFVESGAAARADESYTDLKTSQKCILRQEGSKLDGY